MAPPALLGRYQAEIKRCTLKSTLHQCQTQIQQKNKKPCTALSCSTYFDPEPEASAEPTVLLIISL